MSNFNNLSEEELIKILDQGNLTEEEFGAFTQAMRQQGLQGSIMAIDDPNSEEGRAASEYIEYHQKIPNDHYGNMPEEKIEQSKKILLNGQSGIEDKKLALITLAHVGRIDVYKALEEYEKNPEPKLKIWLNMAIQECQSFLKSDIMGEPTIDISRVSKVGRNEPCPCGSGEKFKKCCIDK